MQRSSAAATVRGVYEMGVGECLRGVLEDELEVRRDGAAKEGAEGGGHALEAAAVLLVEQAVSEVAENVDVVERAAVGRERARGLVGPAVFPNLFRERWVAREDLLGDVRQPLGEASMIHPFLRVLFDRGHGCHGGTHAPQALHLAVLLLAGIAYTTQRTRKLA